MADEGFRDHCAGRLLVGIPPGANVALSARYHFVNIENSRAFPDFEALKSEMRSRSEKLAATAMVRNSYGDSILRSGGLDPDAMYGKTQLLGFEEQDALHQILIGYHPKKDDSDILVEVHQFANGEDHVLQSKSIGADNYPQERADILSVASQFRPVDNGVPPAEPGFCIDGAMFANDGKPPVKERFTLVVTFPDHPDVLFSIDANAIDEVDTDEPSLKRRVDGDLRMMRANYAGGVHVLERGKLEAAGQKGYQVGISAPYDVVPGTQIRKFFWSADGVPNDVTRPFMEVDMTIQPTDDGKSTITSDADAKALWKSLIQGIRIRPGAVRR